MAKRKVYSFVEKKHTRNGILSTVLAGISLFIFLLLAYISAYYRGAAGIYIGTIGLTAMVFSFTGLVVGLKGFSEADRMYTFSKIGSVACGLITVGWLALLLYGI